MRLIFIALLVVTAGFYLTIVLWSLPHITLEADGLKPFDLRPFGYSVEAAEEFNNALSEEGRVFYLDTQHWLDTFFSRPSGRVAGLVRADLVEGACVGRWWRWRLSRRWRIIWKTPLSRAFWWGSIPRLQSRPIAGH